MTIRRLTPVSFPISWPGPDYAEGLYLARDGDCHVVWAQSPDTGRWCEQAASDVVELDNAFVSEELRRQIGRIADAMV